MALKRFLRVLIFTCLGLLVLTASLCAGIVRCLILTPIVLVQVTYAMLLLLGAVGACSLLVAVACGVYGTIRAKRIKTI